MLIMITPNGAPDVTICIPYNKIYNIKFDNNSVFVTYDAGEKIEIEGTYQNKLEYSRITYENADEVKRVLRQFYNAVKDKEAIFYFGNKKKSEVAVEVKKIENEGDESWLVKSLLSK